MTAYSKSSQSIWQKIRNIFTSGYEKIATQELQVAGIMRNKLSGVGYTLTRVVFFIVKSITVIVLLWFAMWLFIFIMAWIIFKFIIFNRTVKPYYKTDKFFTENSNNKRSNTYDNQGNLID